MRVHSIPMNGIVDLPFQVLDHGFIIVEDYMGNDNAIVQAARVEDRFDDGERLLRYLIKNKHTSPFEMCEIKLLVQLPLFVARQWVRHRTANINEYSLRYSEALDFFYVPEQFKAQDCKNRQGSAEPLPVEINKQMRELVINHSREALLKYKWLLEQGSSKELARIVLPVNFYTKWYWKIDLHNLLHFLKLRMDEHAQWEIRQYANMIGNEIVAKWVPITWKIWKEENFK